MDVLEELAPLHPLPAKIVDYRQYAKLKGTYVDALPADGPPGDRPRPCLVQPGGHGHGPAQLAAIRTCRTSPCGPRAGREIRSAFVPGEEGWLLLAADYSQIELRVLAHYSGDERLCEAFQRDEDIHARVASQVNDVPAGPR